MPYHSRLLKMILRLVLHPARLIPKLKIFLKLSIFLTALVILQLGIVQMSRQVDAIRAQTALIIEKNIDPSALFYTESDLALNAEKEVRHRISGLKTGIK